MLSNFDDIAWSNLDDDLAFAEDGGQQQGEIQVVFHDDNDKAAKKARDSEANLRRTQNDVPSWHAWSTVSGEMTALGAEAAKRQELPADDHNAHGDAEVQENDSERVECKLIVIQEENTRLRPSIANAPFWNLIYQITRGTTRSWSQYPKMWTNPLMLQMATLMATPNDLWMILTTNQGKPTEVLTSTASAV